MTDVKLSDGEKIILLMLSEIYDHLKVSGEIEPNFIRAAIHSGNLWGIGQGFPGIFHNYETPVSVVDETVKVLSMWERLEESFQALSQGEKDQLATYLETSGHNIQFPGFDSNNESEHISAAGFLIDHLDRFSKFKGRELNAHMPTLEAHRRMLAVFQPILDEVLNLNFTAAQIAQVMAARRYPGTSANG